MIDPDIKTAVESQLKPGEILLWAGRPDRRLSFGQIFMLIMPVVIFIIVAWLFRGAGFGPMVMFLTFITLLALRQWLSIWFEVYAITDRRVLILERAWPRLTHTINRADITDIAPGIFNEPETIKITSKARSKLLPTLFSMNGRPKQKLPPKPGSVYFLRRLPDAQTVLNILQQTDHTAN